MTILIFCGGALAAAYAADPTGEQNALLKVWGTVAVPIGGVIGYYLRGSKRSGENIN